MEASSSTCIQRSAIRARCRPSRFIDRIERQFIRLVNSRSDLGRRFPSRHKHARVYDRQPFPVFSPFTGENDWLAGFSGLGKDYPFAIDAGSYLYPVSCARCFCRFTYCRKRPFGRSRVAV